MFKIGKKENLTEMGFVKNNDDYVIRKEIDGVSRVLFTVYKGSPYLRYSKTGYVMEEQLKLIFQWGKNNLIEWEDD
jgi:hypothetical protein